MDKTWLIFAPMRRGRLARCKGFMVYQYQLDKDILCALEYGLEVFGGKWKFRIIVAP